MLIAIIHAPSHRLLPHQPRALQRVHELGHEQPLEWILCQPWQANLQPIVIHRRPSGLFPREERPQLIPSQRREVKRAAEGMLVSQSHLPGSAELQILSPRTPVQTAKEHEQSAMVTGQLASDAMLDISVTLAITMSTPKRQKSK